MEERNKLNLTIEVIRSDMTFSLLEPLTGCGAIRKWKAVDWLLDIDY